MKRGTPDHPKVIRLAEVLKIDRPYAVGLLELLWHFTSDYAPAGDIGRFSDCEIAKSIYWGGDATSLVNGLVESRWIDANRKHRFVIHDWPEHADDSVHNKLARATRLFADGTMPSLKRLSDTERKKINELYEKSVRTPSARRAHAKRIKAHCLSPALALALASSSSPRERAEDPATSGDDDERLSQIKRWLSEYMATVGAQWGEPDDHIVRSVDGAARGRSLDEIHAVLLGIYEKGLKPGRSWAWFVKVLENAFQVGA